MSMPPDLMAALLGQAVEGPEQTAALARKLRGDQAVNTLAAFSGDPILQKFGAAGAKRNTNRVEGLRKARQVKAQRDMTQGYYDQATADRQATRTQGAEEFTAEMEYKNRALAQRLEEARIKAESSGSKGVTRVLDPTGRDEATRIGDARRVIMKGSQMLQDDPDFNPGSKGVPFHRTVSNTIARYGIGSDDDIKAHEFWREYKQWFELAERNNMFGATLTDNEQASWNSAVAGAEMNPQQLRDVMSSMAKAYDKKAWRIEQSYGGTGRYGDNSQVRYLLGFNDDEMPEGMQGAPAPAGLPAGAPPGPATASPGGIQMEIIP